MAKQNKNLVAEELKINAIDCLESIFIRFFEVLNLYAIILKILVKNCRLDAFIALRIHVSGLKLECLFHKAIGLKTVFIIRMDRIHGVALFFVSFFSTFARTARFKG